MWDMATDLLQDETIYSRLSDISFGALSGSQEGHSPKQNSQDSLNPNNVFSF